MSANIIDGKKLSDVLCQSIGADAVSFSSEFEKLPCISLINIGDDAASKVYVANKIKLAESVHIKSELYELPSVVSQKEVESLIFDLNNRKDVHGILLQLPIPKHLDEFYLMNMISSEKDVDGLTLINQGKLYRGTPGLCPCTPMGIMHILGTVHKNLPGLHAAVLGRSLIVGKPISQMLLSSNCTVTTLHSRSRDSNVICKSADILISAVGIPGVIDDTYVKQGATVIDVGINRIEIDGKRKIVGDVNFDKVYTVAGNLTKVPGGVGPLTVSFLMYNTVKAAKMQSEKK